MGPPPVSHSCVCVVCECRETKAVHAAHKDRGSGTKATGRKVKKVMDDLILKGEGKPGTERVS